MKIFKYPLLIGTHTYIDLPGVFPTAFQPRFVGEQNGTLTLWLGVNEEMSLKRYQIIVVGTGWDYDSSWTYLGSCQIDIFVWHVFLKGDA